MTEIEELRNTVGDLMIDVNVLQRVLVHVVAEQASRSDDPEASLRQFADEIHASIDLAEPPPADIARKVELARSRIDAIMVAARRRLQG
jgi:hypothetical protein